jgi:hypothetical protein
VTLVQRQILSSTHKIKISTEIIYSKAPGQVEDAEEHCTWMGGGESLACPKNIPLHKRRSSESFPVLPLDPGRPFENFEIDGRLEDWKVRQFFWLQRTVSS